MFLWTDRIPSPASEDEEQNHSFLKDNKNNG
jgi:hypothetical protein